MTKSKVVLTIFSAFMIVLIMVGSVQAQDEPPGVGQFTPRYDEDAFPGESIGVDGAGQKVFPVSPVEEYVFTRTPKFYFTRDYWADRYEIELVDFYTSATVSIFRGAGTCQDDYCYLQPDIRLKNYDYFESEGYYKWRVKARLGGEWETEYSDWAEFIVLSTGFKSTFDSNRNNWYDVSGEWTLANGSLKTHGYQTDTWASVFQRHMFSSLQYTVVMKRKNNAPDSNSIIIAGNPYPLEMAAQTWNRGIYFQYNNNKLWSLWERYDNTWTPLVGWTYHSGIKPYDWNKLRISASEGYLDLWINGEYLGWVPYDGPVSSMGVVGIAMYRWDYEKEPLLVDKAKVKTLYFSPFATHDPAMQLGLDAVDPAMRPEGTREDWGSSGTR